MILTMAVKMTLVLLLLCSGFVDFNFSSNRLRHFRFNETIKTTWTEIWEECTQNNESLVTLYDEEDAMFTANFTSDTVWLGLRKVRNITWSNGQPFTFNKSSVDVTNGTQRCQAVNITTWEDDFCSTPKYFMCWRNDTNNYTLVDTKKTWCQALQHCRNNNSDLVSISDEKQNDLVIEKGNNTSFWIGLMHDEWEWEDKGCSSFRNWDNTSTTYKAESCTTHLEHGKQRLLFRYGCGLDASLFCSRGHVRIKVISQKSTWEEAFHYCQARHTRLLCIENKEDQEAVVQWLNHTQEDGPFWIGLRQSRIFGFWIWSDRVVSYSNWNGSQQPELPMSNHCGVINKQENYTWSDKNCLVPLHFLCEEENVYMKK